VVSVPEAAAPVVEPVQRDKHTSLRSRAEEPRASTRAPEDWLVEGNRLRAERRWAKADDAYTRAALHAPNTQTAYVARVASGAVRLEHLGDARGALARYRAAQEQLPRGALAEEILWGIVEAERALGDRDREHAALERFLHEFPGSPLADQARSRLD
jgi:tetratricopeptide (TPR) repeat protein